VNKALTHIAAGPGSAPRTLHEPTSGLAWDNHFRAVASVNNIT